MKKVLFIAIEVDLSGNIAERVATVGQDIANEVKLHGANVNCAVALRDSSSVFECDYQILNKSSAMLAELLK